jgi:hypothetical protein
MFSEPTAGLPGLAIQIGRSSPIDLTPDPKLVKTKLTKLYRRIFRRPARVHDPFLSLSMTFFNDAEGWRRGFQGVITRGSRLMTDY